MSHTLGESFFAGPHGRASWETRYVSSLASLLLAGSLASAPSAAQKPTARHGPTVHAAAFGDEEARWYRDAARREAPGCAAFAHPARVRSPEMGGPRPRPEAAQDTGRWLFERGLASTIEALDGTHGPLPDEGRAREAWLGAACVPADLLSDLACGAAGECRLAPRAPAPCARAVAEDGSEPVGALRMQVAADDVPGFDGNGASTDILRQVATRLPDLALWVSVTSDRLDDLRAAMDDWRIAAPARIHLVPEPYVPSQWAQDNGKGATVGCAAGERRSAVLTPRYASVGEIESTHVPWDSGLTARLATAGLAVVQSPYLFQGGNLLVIRAPSGSGRWLLAGEAEVFRNVALGLTRREAEEALRVTFSVDRVVILPAVSFHIDMEVSVRARDGAPPLAFVNDTRAAARLIAAAGLDALGLESTTERADALAIRKAFENARAAGGKLPRAFLARFAMHPQEHAQRNASRVMLAADWLSAFNDLEGRDTAHDAYLESLRAREADRRRLHARFTALGFEVVPVPSLSDSEVSASSVNAVQLPDAALVPAMGGLFKTLDAAVRDDYVALLPDGVAFVPVLSAASQHRYGGVHCSMSVLP